ncbi:hypothetical protein D3C74_468150 [compost metagenome]
MAVISKPLPVGTECGVISDIEAGQCGVQADIRICQLIPEQIAAPGEAFLQFIQPFE